MRKEYFKISPDDPQPLTAEVTRTVRFQEVDMMGIVWHGHYASYFEDARLAVGKKYGVSYHDFYRERVAAPIRKLHTDYFRPLFLGISTQSKHDCTIRMPLKSIMISLFMMKMGRYALQAIQYRCSCAP